MAIDVDHIPFMELDESQLMGLGQEEMVSCFLELRDQYNRMKDIHLALVSEHAEALKAIELLKAKLEKLEGKYKTT